MPIIVPKPRLLLPNDNSLRKGLVFDYAFFEGKGPRIINLAKFKTPGLFVGTPTWKQGRYGQGLEFNNASTDRVTVTTVGEQNNIHQITVESLAIQASGMSNGGRIFHKGVTGVHANRYWEHGEIDAGNMYFAGDWSGGQGAWRISAGAPSADVLHHIVSTYNDSATTNDPILYVDGQSVGVTEVLGPSGSRSADSNILYIGGSAGATESWSGIIYLVRVWNRILSPRSVLELYEDPYALYKSSTQIYFFKAPADAVVVSPSVLTSTSSVQGPSKTLTKDITAQSTTVSLQSPVKMVMKSVNEQAVLSSIQPSEILLRKIITELAVTGSLPQEARSILKQIDVQTVISALQSPIVGSTQDLTVTPQVLSILASLIAPTARDLGKPIGDDVFYDGSIPDPASTSNSIVDQVIYDEPIA